MRQVLCLFGIYNLVSMMKYSLVIPVYNVEKYLSRCLDSIISQTYNNFEVICVNDGSTDSSQRILESYVKKDARIKLVNQDNRGLGEARNTGIAYATGDYIWFIDSDDWIPDPNALRKIDDKVNVDNCEVLLFDYYYGDVLSYRRCSCIDSYTRESIGYLDYIKYSLTGKLRFFAWLKIFKSDILRRSNFRFPQGWYEDIPIISMISMFPSLKISYIKESLYHYYNRTGSIMNSFDCRLLHLLDRAEEIKGKLAHLTVIDDELMTFYNDVIATIIIRSHKSDDKFLIRESLKKKCRLTYSNIMNDHHLSTKRKLLLIAFMGSPLKFFNIIF